MTWYLVLMKDENIIEICSYDNPESQLEYYSYLMNNSYGRYNRVLMHTEIN